MNSNFAEVEQRVKRYWYTDGIGELVGGGLFVLLGLYFAIQESLGPNSILTGILQASFALLFIGGTMLGRRLINALKDRLTYPRTGYVEYQAKQPVTRWGWLGVAGLGLFVAALMVLIVRMLQFFDSIVALTALIATLIFIFIGGKSAGIRRFYVLGVISFTLGLVLSVSGLPNGYSLGLFYGLTGMCICISGGLILRHYLQENPLPADTERQNG